MLRTAIAQLLAADATLAALLSGGVYPLSNDQPSSLSRQYYPAAFDEFGGVLPCALVQDDGATPGGSTSKTGQMFARVVFWQARGRDVIDAAAQRVYTLLDGAQPTVSGVYVYRLSFAGEGGAQDQALSAEQLWSRWQADVSRRAV